MQTDAILTLAFEYIIMSLRWSNPLPMAVTYHLTNCKNHLQRAKPRIVSLKEPAEQSLDNNEDRQNFLGDIFFPG